VEAETFTEADITQILPGREDFVHQAYHDGVLSRTEDSRDGQPLYRLNSFYGALDVFVISHQEVYRTFPEETRLALDSWYFRAYMDGLDADRSKAPTADVIMTLEETLNFIDRQTRTPYLNDCDCRSLRGDCGLPTRTCITYRNGANTFVDRGHSEELTKEEAKEIVRQADRDGLMHTVNPDGICNCCGDCCYLFRGQQERNSTGLWPKANYVVSIDEDRCVGCGLCTTRCHFRVLTPEAGRILAEPERCIGCGICATACPAEAITMKGREG
jgi:Pyruvate/2-oxoacid:ferredoxin oxidoreductase delta subunit